jgi:hypothetical protein
MDQRTTHAPITGARDIVGYNAFNVLVMTWLALGLVFI